MLNGTDLRLATPHVVHFGLLAPFPDSPSSSP